MSMFAVPKAGYERTGGPKGARKCQPGYSKSSPGMYKCQRCSSTKVQPLQGQKSCVKCAGGRAANPARTSCVGAPPVAQLCSVLELFRHVPKGICRSCIILRSAHPTQTHPASFELCATAAAVPSAAKTTTRPTNVKASPPKPPPSSPPPPPAAALAPVVVAGGAHLRFQGFATKPTSGDYADTSVLPGAIQVVARTIISSKCCVCSGWRPPLSLAALGRIRGANCWTGKSLAVELLPLAVAWSPPFLRNCQPAPHGLLGTSRTAASLVMTIDQRRCSRTSLATRRASPPRTAPHSISSHLASAGEPGLGCRLTSLALCTRLSEPHTICSCTSHEPGCHGAVWHTYRASCARICLTDTHT